MKSPLFLLVWLVFSVGSAAAADCPVGDLDNNCRIDWRDLKLFALQWLDEPGGSANLDDANGVNMFDFALLAGNWNEKWLGSLVINEFMASNNNTLEDPCEPNEFPDWIELYNSGTNDVSIEGLFLTDDLGNSTKWQIPDGVIIEANEYLIFFADDDDEQGSTHTNFKLSADGDEIGLFDTDGSTLIDGITFGSQATDISYGRYPDVCDTWRFMGVPTPAAQNNDGYLGRVADTKFSHNRGFYDAPFNVAITCETDGATIRYTINGSEPNESTGIVYTDRIPISTTSCLRAAAFKTGWLASDIDTQTYIFLDDVLNQPANPNGFPSTWGVYVKDAWPDIYAGDPVPADYEMDPCIPVNRSSLESLPSLSLVMDVNDLFDPNYGIYSNPMKRHDLEAGEDWERATSVEYLDPNGGANFQLNCAIRIQGGWSRYPSENPKHSFRLLFKSDYGPSSLEFPLFGESASKNFNGISLRGGFNDSWAVGSWNDYKAQYFRDQWARDTQLAMGQASSHGTWVHLYINGLYWGLFNPVERLDGNFMAGYFGGDSDDYDVFNHNSFHSPDGSRWYTGDDREPPIDGNFAAWDAMMAIADTGVGTYEQYQDIQEYLDVDNYIDHVILNRYVGCSTWTGWNFYAGRKREPNAGFKFFSWDTEGSFDVYNSDSGWYIWNGDSLPGHLFGEMQDNTEFRMDFADRIHRHMFNNGPLTSQSGQDRWTALDGRIFDTLMAELGRWGRVATTRDNEYVTERTRILTSFFPNRGAWVIDMFRSEGLYPSIDAPVFYIDGGHQHGGYVSDGAVLDINNPNGSGTIYYTLDGNDPRIPGSGAVAGTAYSGPITLNKSSYVKARVKNGSTWSALNEATFAVGDLVDNLRITEIMYHPQDANDPNIEFVELKNIGPNSLNLHWASFTEGIDFTFPDTELAAGGYVVVVNDQSAFTAKYGTGPNIAGQYNGKLDNGCERIGLQDANCQTILDFSYKDGWCPITDGDGFSLTINNPNNSDTNSWGEKKSWSASTFLGGSPGEADGGPHYGDIVINEVLAHSDVAPGDWIELHNTTDAVIDINDWYLSDDDANLTKYKIAPNTIPANGYIVFTEDDHFGNEFALSENGETVYLTSGLDANGNLTGYRQQEDFGASENGVSFGRYLKSTGTYNFVAMSETTMGVANAYPKVGPIVISEIMYHPNWPDSGSYDNKQFEYVELYNITDSAVTLYDDNEAVPWKFTNGIDYNFPGSPNEVTIAAHDYLLVVKNPTAFAQRYPSVPSGVILGPYEGYLDNAGEKVELSMPGDEADGIRYFIRVDRVNYSDGSAQDGWPVGADGDGNSLTRIETNLYGNDPNNWDANSPSPDG